MLVCLFVYFVTVIWCFLQFFLLAFFIVLLLACFRSFWLSFSASFCLSRFSLILSSLHPVFPHPLASFFVPFCVSVVVFRSFFLYLFLYGFRDFFPLLLLYVFLSCSPSFFLCFCRSSPLFSFFRSFLIFCA